MQTYRAPLVWDNSLWEWSFILPRARAGTIPVDSGQEGTSAEKESEKAWHATRFSKMR